MLLLSHNMLLPHMLRVPNHHAHTGLKRLNMAHVATHVLEQTDMLPAVSQGAIGIQCREGDEIMLKYLDALNCPKTKVGTHC